MSTSRRRFLGIAAGAVVAAAVPLTLTRRLDDAAWIQALIDRGGPVFLPPGNYVLDRPIRIRDGVSIIGSRFEVRSGSHAIQVTDRDGWEVRNCFIAVAA